MADDKTVLLTQRRTEAPRMGGLRAIDVPLVVIALILALTLAATVGSSVQRARAVPGADPTPPPTLEPTPAPTMPQLAPRPTDQGHGGKKKDEGRGADGDD